MAIEFNAIINEIDSEGNLIKSSNLIDEVKEKMKTLERNLKELKDLEENYQKLHNKIKKLTLFESPFDSLSEEMLQDLLLSILPFIDNIILKNYFLFLLMDRNNSILNSVRNSIENCKLTIERENDFKLFLETPIPCSLVHKKDIYFIESENGLLKIGISNNPKKRLQALQNQTIYKLKLIAIIPEGGKEKEARLHDKFREYNEFGEWYRKNDDILDYVQYLKEKYEEVL